MQADFGLQGHKELRHPAIVIPSLNSTLKKFANIPLALPHQLVYHLYACFLLEICKHPIVCASHSRSYLTG